MSLHPTCAPLNTVASHSQRAETRSDGVTKRGFLSDGNVLFRKLCYWKVGDRKALEANDRTEQSWAT